MMRLTYLLATLTYFFSISICTAQLTVSEQADAETLAQKIVGEGIQIVPGSVTLRTNDGATGIFDNTNTGIDFNSGVILSTGKAVNAVGPNNTGYKGTMLSQETFDDPDLILIENAARYDVTALEFEFIPICSRVELDFIFASEEYPEFVNLFKNDVFAFFVWGNNPNGGTYEAENIAIVPETGDIVSINTINDQVNSSYYVDNKDGQDIQFDGLTKRITSSLEVVPCETYRIKLIIADTDDGIYDAAVFLEENGLTCKSSSLAFDKEQITVVENCSTEDFALERKGDLASTMNVQYYFQGSATHNQDYNFQETDLFSSGESTLNYTDFAAVADNLEEGEETVLLIAEGDICGVKIRDTLTIIIADGLSVDAGPDREECLDTFHLKAQEIPGLTGEWIVPTNVSVNDINDPNTIATLAQNGTYTLTWKVTDNNNCEATDDVILKLQDNKALEFTLVPPSCHGDPIGMEIPNPENGIDFKWSLSGVINEDFTGTGPFTHNYQDQGDLTISITTEGDGCYRDTTYTFSTPSAISIELSSNPENCGMEDGSVAAIITGGNTNSDYTYQWIKVSDNSAIGSTAQVTGLPAAEYELTAIDDEQCEAKERVIVASINPFTIDAIGVQNVSCFNLCDGTARLTITPANGDYTINWPANFNANGINATEVCAGDYSVEIVENSTQCKESVPFTVNSPAEITANFDVQEDDCGLGTGSITTTISGGNAVAGYAYQWTTNDNPNLATSQNLSDIVGDTYSLTVTDDNNCQNSWDVNVNSTAPFDINASQVSTISCFSECDGSVELSMNPANANYEVTWPDNVQETSATTAEGFCAGNFSIDVLDVNSQCKVTVSVLFESPEEITLQAIEDESVCKGQTVSKVAFAQGGSGTIEYQWNDGSANAINSNTASWQPDQNLDISVIATDANGCESNTVNFSILVPEDLSIKLITTDNANRVCPGECITVEAVIESGVPDYVYSWNTDPNASDASIDVCPTGPETITVTVVDECRQKQDASISLDVFEMPSLSLAGEFENCEKGELCIELISDQTLSNVDWSTPLIWNENGATEYCFDLQEIGQYSLDLSYVTADRCKGEKSFDEELVLSEGPTAAFELLTEVLSESDPQLEVENNSTNSYSEKWIIDDEEFDALPSYFDGEAGSYELKLIVESVEGCTDSTTRTFVVNPDYNVYIPNAFSVLAEAPNNSFGPVLPEELVSEYDFRIYNRWGELVFHSNNPKDKWDGHNTLGRLCPGGSYVYFLKLVGADGKEFEHSGPVHLID